MNYSETIDFLYSQLPQFQRIGAPAYKAGLDTTIALDNHLGNPHQSYKTVHIAGTNGKGSTSQMIYEALRAEGHSVGLYTSPHLVDFRERIVVDGEMISPEAVVEFVECNLPVINDLKPSFFELTVAMALWWFKIAGVDYAVIEVGMGGRLDSTNIITPEVSVITNISLDHTQFLGDSVEKIAGEKAGIIKARTPVVVGQSCDEYNDVFTLKARELNSPITFADMEPKQPYSPAMRGSAQRFNAQTAYVALKILGVREGAVQYGIETARVRGRWQLVCDKPLTICDTAHNEAGLKLLVEQLQELTTSVRGRKVYFILGVVADKDLSKILPLLPSAAHYLFTEPSIPRALPAVELASLAHRCCLKGETHSSVAQAYVRAVELATEKDIIMIGGSTFTVADFLGIVEE